MNKKDDRLTYPLIALAIHGDIVAVNQILKIYEPYIIKLSQKTLFDECGNPHFHIEPEIQRALETKLILAITKFKL